MSILSISTIDVRSDRGLLEEMSTWVQDNTTGNERRIYALACNYYYLDREENERLNLMAVQYQMQKTNS